jgi:hypothetical protein
MEYIDVTPTWSNVLRRGGPFEEQSHIGCNDPAGPS